MKKEYVNPAYEVEILEFNEVILTSSVSRDDGNHSFNGNPDLSI